MSASTDISWCDKTWSPWEGCQKVGPGCDNCYAEVRNQRFAKGANWGPGAPRRKTVDWSKPYAWDRAAAAAGTRYRVFPSLCDPFDNAVDPEWRAELFLLMRNTPHLDWTLLTKRIGNAHEMIGEALILLGDAFGESTSLLPSWPWPNVWLGATVVNQAEADRDIVKLMALPAAKRFLSIEPMLGPIDLREDLGLIACPADVDWIIAGGESGPKARPAHPDWFRSLRDQCASVGVPFHFKQWGEWTSGENITRTTGKVDSASWVDGRWMPSRENLADVGGHRDDEPDLYRIGKKAAGRLLDGVTHDAFPGATT